MTLPPEVRELAERELTRAQLEVFLLEQSGYGLMPIARRLILTRSAVRDRLHNAHTKLEKHGCRQDGSGKWYLNREEAA